MSAFTLRCQWQSGTFSLKRGNLCRGSNGQHVVFSARNAKCSSHKEERPRRGKALKRALLSLNGGGLRRPKGMYRSHPLGNIEGIRKHICHSLKSFLFPKVEVCGKARASLALSTAETYPCVAHEFSEVSSEGFITLG